MFRQLIKGFSLLSVIVTLAFTNAVLTAHGQSSRLVKAQVPFEFIVGEKQLPAGQYDVRPSSDEGSALIIQNAATQDARIRLTNSIQTNSGNERARLVFHRYDNTYFLAEVWRGGMSTGRRLLPSKREQAMKRELASMKKDYDTVVLLARMD